MSSFTHSALRHTITTPTPHLEQYKAVLLKMLLIIDFLLPCPLCPLSQVINVIFVNLKNIP